LQPLFNDAFGGSIVGVATFARDSRGDVTGFTANGPAIRGLSFRRSSISAGRFHIVDDMNRSSIGVILGWPALLSPTRAL